MSINSIQNTNKEAFETKYNKKRCFFFNVTCQFMTSAIVDMVTAVLSCHLSHAIVKLKVAKRGVCGVAMLTASMAMPKVTGMIEALQRKSLQSWIP